MVDFEAYKEIKMINIIKIKISVRMKEIIENLSQSKKNILRFIGCGLLLFFIFLVPASIGGLNVAHANFVGWFGGLVMDVVGIGAEAVTTVAAQVLSWLLEWVWIPIFSWILTVMGNLLDQSINFSLDAKNISGIPGIKIGWVIMRDFINMTFIFILLYIAISTILGTAGSATKKTLANLVFAVILINFSYFITGLIIDAGNIVALTFRDAIVTKGTHGGLGAIVMNAIKLSQAYEPSGLGYASFVSAAVRMILIGVTIYAFFLAAMLFIVRIISFVVLLILSPIGFIGTLSPKFAEQSKKWWATLIGQTLVAPVFLFFFYVIAQITTSDGLFKNTLDPKANLDVTYYFNFAIIIGLILTAVKLSKQFSSELGGKVANFASGVGKLALGVAGGATIGATALAGRAALGRGASAVLSKKGKGLAEAGSKSGVKGFGARLALKGLKRTEKSSFDIRATGVGKAGLGLVKGVSFGRASGSGGFKEDVKETARKERKRMDEMFGIDETQKQRYAEEVLQKPIWAGGRKIDPDSLLGKISKKVSAGGIISKESGIRIELNTELEKLKNHRENIRAGGTGTLSADELKDVRGNISHLKEELKELAGEARKKTP
ncbi:hypothetical protein KJ991_02020 [Patescibacteria group bacterium]|nr:hypothetical protein [Patescibacteria group bacterium]MBU4057442.1 hypothetical protein [Patescibacteria group bacterium]MBU4115576.1 hypothetical protein [Patescibacteria group bacterium]